MNPLNNAEIRLHLPRLAEQGRKANSQARHAFRRAAVVKLSRSWLPGRTSPLAATCVHMNPKNESVFRIGLHTGFALWQKSFSKGLYVRFLIRRKTQ
jgi:hypothetical protein